MTVFLDSGPLGAVTNPKMMPATVAILNWVEVMREAGHKFVVPAIADYEVRRELVRGRKAAGIVELNSWQNDYLPISDSAVRLASDLWAYARNIGRPTGAPNELDADVLIAAQALDQNIPRTDFIIATVNVGHLSLFAPADEWANIKP